jgi:hypothetical protein
MTDSSILAGVDKLIDEALGLRRGKYQDKKTCQLLSKGKKLDFDGNTLIQKILDQVTSKWNGRKSRSSENWRWKPNPKLKTNSEEIVLERWIVRTAKGNDWVNQVPVASGLTSSAGGRRAIDLVHQCRDGWYEFIELKVDDGAGTPLFAAMEILQYGVLYIFSREHASTLGYKKIGMLGATGIHLKVLAPATYYEGYDLSWLEERINSGLAKFLAQGERGSEFEMDFKFESLSRSPVAWKVQV